MKILKYVVIASCAIFCSLMASADEVSDAKKPLKVLMIGNSFSICVLREMPQVAKDLGLPLDLASLFIGGCSLERHWKNCEKPDEKPYGVKWSYTSCDRNKVPFLDAIKSENKKSGAGNIPAMLAADKWDVITVQQASNFSWRSETYEPYGSNLIALIKKLAPQAKIYVQQTWAYSTFNPRLKEWNIDQAKMFDCIEKAYSSFATKHNLDQILMGKAVQRYRKELPVTYTEKSNDDDVCGALTFFEKDGKWQSKGDALHLNREGEFFQALVWTAKLFNADVTKSKYVPKYLKQKQNRVELMRKIASELR